MTVHRPTDLLIPVREPPLDGIGRVLLLTDADVFAGTERHMLDLSVALRASGADVSVGCPVPSPLADRATGAGVEAIDLRKRGRVGVGVVLELRRLLRSKRVDLIHAHNGRTALQAALAVRLAGRGRLVVTQHFLRPNRLGASGVQRVASRWMHRWVGGQVAEFVAISVAVQVQMLARGDCPSDHLTVVPNGISDPLAGALPARATTREGLGVASDAVVVICAARLEAEKGIETLIEAVGKNAYDVSTYCFIAGQGVLSSSLRAHIDAAGLGERVRMLGFRQDVHSLIAAADVLVLPSPDEPFGLVLVEAMALGRPVVACRNGGPLEVVDDRVTGLLVPPNDAAALADALGQLCRDGQQRRRMGEAGRRRFEERFTADRMAVAMLAVYGRASGGDRAVWHDHRLGSQQ